VIDGRYRLLERIGSGGMADVWCAEDTHLGRRVAIKVLHHRFAQDREFVERFRREAEAAASLQHPNVVNVFDRGELDGTFYIAMQYLEGESLKDMIQDGIEVDQAVGITRQILDASRFAHAHGVIHRDLKPHNVIVGADGRATVTDFGIARAGSSEITQTGSIMGTVAYLSPEQAQGHEVSATSDLYSVGVILYEMLTGRVPFQADTPVAVALKQVAETPRLPSALNTSVPPALDAVVMRSLAKDPNQRFQSAQEFTSALDEAVASPATPGTFALANQPPTRALAQTPSEQTAVRGPEPPVALPGEVPPVDGAGPPSEQGWSRRRWIIIGVLVALLAGLVAWALTRPDTVTVPPVIGQQVSAATQILEERGLDTDIRTVPNDARRDTVLEQDPTAGARVDEGSSVILTVSGGPGTAEIPSVRGLTERDATRKLQRAGFEVEVAQQFSDSVAKGRAVGTDPSQGTEIKGGSLITLLISKGTNKVEVPNVVGLDESQARSVIRDADLVPEVERDAGSSAPEGEVTEQDPQAGDRVKKGSTVTIFVSEGLVTVPDVEGRTQSSATRILRQAGFNVDPENQPTSNPDNDGRVLNQSPNGGARRPRGSTVTIFIGRFS
jgi:serine/threonine-protein kinase